MKRHVLLRVVVCERCEQARARSKERLTTEQPIVLKLLPGEHQALLIRWDAFLLLDELLDHADGRFGKDFEGDGLSG